MTTPTPTPDTPRFPQPPRPWYREPWPWIFMAGPFIVIVACLVTAWIAAESYDGLVTEDYYKRGMEINKTLEREQLAAHLAIRARIVFGGDGRQIRVELTGNGELPNVLLLRILHPTRTGMDQTLTLRSATPGVFQATLAESALGRRAIVIEDGKGTWRLSGEAATIGVNGVVTLAARGDARL